LNTELTRLEDYADPTLIDFFIADGWASFYIRDLLGVDLNIKNFVLTLIFLFISIKTYRVIKKKLKSK
jgi:hypothetical protein